LRVFFSFSAQVCSSESRRGRSVISLGFARRQAARNVPPQAAVGVATRRRLVAVSGWRRSQLPGLRWSLFLFLFFALGGGWSLYWVGDVLDCRASAVFSSSFFCLFFPVPRSFSSLSRSLARSRARALPLSLSISISPSLSVFLSLFLSLSLSLSLSLFSLFLSLFVSRFLFLFFFLSLSLSLSLSLPLVLCISLSNSPSPSLSPPPLLSLSLSSLYGIAHIGQY
jgi:hypothetical protein